MGPGARAASEKGRACTHHVTGRQAGGVAKILSTKFSLDGRCVSLQNNLLVEQTHPAMHVKVP